MVDADPRTEADTDLLHHLRWSKQQNEEVILMGDFNQNIYTSRFARQLADDDLKMEEQYQKLHGEEAPFHTFEVRNPSWGALRPVVFLLEVTLWRHTTRLEVWETTDST